MDRFVSHDLLCLDTKGGISVPPPRRALLARDGLMWEPERFRAELAKATVKVRAFKQEPGNPKAAATPLEAWEE
jgi:DNA-binding transcriptional regulator/RsmH inhibitor MraZ